VCGASYRYVFPLREGSGASGRFNTSIPDGRGSSMAWVLQLTQQIPYGKPLEFTTAKPVMFCLADCANSLDSRFEVKAS
jgi:hypothetical protein